MTEYTIKSRVTRFLFQKKFQTEIILKEKTQIFFQKIWNLPNQ